MRSLAILALVFSSLNLTALEPPNPAHVKNLAGCFTVSYRFVENGANDYEILNALEWITVKPGENGSLVAQHYGLFDGEIMKHFYEVWTALPSGAWQQKVHGPSGAHRYTCESHVRLGQLRCESKAAPKPQRDRKRKDYDVLNRANTIQVTPKGWVQSEVNDKVKNDGSLVATEVGWVEYRRVDDEKCEAAKKQFPNG